MTDAIDIHLTSAREAMAEGRTADARNSYARAAALSRESGAPLLQAHALRHLSDIDREAGHPEQALAHAEQAAALYRANGHRASIDMANALRLRALALDGLRRATRAEAAWVEARNLYAEAGVGAGVAECERRLDAAD
jgi:tetratricopeptide (TPR) repeat protein